MRSSDGAVWASVAATLRDVVLPELGDGHARRSAIELVGLAEYGRSRGPDPEASRAAELAAALARLAANPLVPGESAGWVADRCTAALVAAVGRDDEHARAVRETLRPVLVRHLDDDLSTGAPLAEAFRGRLPGG